MINLKVNLVSFIKEIQLLVNPDSLPNMFTAVRSSPFFSLLVRLVIRHPRRPRRALDFSSPEFFSRPLWRFPPPLTAPGSPRMVIRLFGRSFVPSFVQFVCPSVRLFVCVFVRSFVQSFVSSFVHMLVRSFVSSFARSFLRSVVWSFVRSFARSFVLPFVRSSICSRIPSNSLFIYSGNSKIPHVNTSFPLSPDGSMFLAGIIIQPSVRIPDLLIIN